MSGNFKKTFDDFFQFFPVVTGVYKGLQGLTGHYNDFQGVTRGYIVLQWVTRVTRVTGYSKGLQKTCSLTRTSPDTFS